LAALLAGADEGELDVIVVCNGCHDGTAEAARQVAPFATILEIPVPSKVAALNAGDRVARYFPRFYLDADIELSVAAVRQVASVLRQGHVLCAAPKPFFDLAGRSWPIRAFYDVWKEVPYRALDMVGSGVYAVSEQGRARFGEFPQVTADDQFVQQQFEPAHLKSVGEASFVVHPPRSLRGLVAIRARVYRGNRELAASGLARVNPPPSGAGTVLRLARQPRRAPAVAVYVAVNVLARRRARRAAGTEWERDESARREAGTPRSLEQNQEEPELRHVCYVMSRYPAVSHTFVIREVLALRAGGTEVETVSVHRPDEQDLLAMADKQEADRTWSILPLDRPAFVRAHRRAVCGHPFAYFRALAEAVGAAPPGWRGTLWQLFYFAEAISLWDHADALKVRHLHAHLANVAADICWLACAFGRMAQPRQNWRWSFTMHGSAEFYSTERFNLAQKVQRADGVICISEYTRSQLMYLSDAAQWAKLRVVHCGADLARYPYCPPRSSEGLSVLCVARLTPPKGLDILVSAIGALVDGGTDVRLTIVGSGPLEGSLRRSAERIGVAQRVSFAGAVGQDDMAAYYAQADVFCLSSFAEGIPVVLMEAMATGRPVVATRITGVPELVEEGVSGFLVAPGNVDQLAGALGRLAASPALRESLGRAGRAKVEEAFDAVRCAGQVAEVFDEMAAAGRRRS
jgi:glycosyltransferase involved in cell wall biosynthesis